jgi:ubiquinone/menaquinone biosynthesis C-methylase UbiE
MPRFLSVADGGEHQASERGQELLDVQPGASILEIGYCTGHSLVRLAKSVGTGGRVTGIDISPKMRDVARKRVSEAGMADGADLLVGETPPLPMEDASFDVVTMSFTLELLPLKTIPALLAECRRVLRPGGRLGVASTAAVEQGEDNSSLERTYIWMLTHFPHIVDCQPIHLEKLVSEAGFTLAKLERILLFTMPVGIVVAKGCCAARYSLGDADDSEGFGIRIG